MFFLVLTLLPVLLCTGFPFFHMLNALPVLIKKDYVSIIIRKNRSISILVPCFNEEDMLQTAIIGMKKIGYENFEIIYINDGSTDGTLSLLQESLDLKKVNRSARNRIAYKQVKGFYHSRRYSNVFVVDKENGGKADALNAGIDYAKNELVLTLDADSILEPDALQMINRGFQDRSVIAAGGMVHVLQGRKKFSTPSSVSLKLKHILRFQILEYLKGFYIYKASLARVKALAIISGSFGVFDRRLLLELGGYRDTVGEDIDITLRFQTYLLSNPTKRILFIPEAVSYTECPETWRGLFIQRIRWQKAFVDCAIHYHKILLKTVFNRSLSFFFTVDAFFVGTFFTYVVVFYLLLLIIFPNPHSIIIILTYLIALIVFNLLYTIIALYITSKYGTTFRGLDKIRLLETIALDLIVYRFVLMFFIIAGTIAYFLNKEGWKKVARTGRDYENR
ncbi:glycosyltransferase family 2 protein [Aquibacillus salsiterrae]|uniref:Glycosyltransferase family 2 protein n=1 Tax=Aquibacillus salsiterrae TaxID=2950439 RepID=A0A9X3WFL2_9BACI|nr:glycosyltransferase family 2 protein [Aquibacillus salsiterrae]MDC3417546.1 glycosyltransferase family 2 protein [Aquibacillus salsiterrae]